MINPFPFDGHFGEYLWFNLSFPVQFAVLFEREADVIAQDLRRMTQPIVKGKVLKCVKGILVYEVFEGCLFGQIVVKLVKNFCFIEGRALCGRSGFCKNFSLRRACDI